MPLLNDRKHLYGYKNFKKKKCLNYGGSGQIEAVLDRLIAMIGRLLVSKEMRVFGQILGVRIGAGRLCDRAAFDFLLSDIWQ